MSRPFPKWAFATLASSLLGIGAPHIAVLAGVVMAITGCKNSAPSEPAVTEATTEPANAPSLGLLTITLGSPDTLVLAAKGAWLYTLDPSIVAVRTVNEIVIADTITSGQIKGIFQGSSKVCEQKSLSDTTKVGCWDVTVVRK
ncbi:MAG: hypothetical protein JWN50_800 [Parcubacteria group bacterium]|nr:hypothetical protein [Parcubacteria group bacterium]